MTTLHDFGKYPGIAFGHFSFGLSQFHGHGSWLVCEVALRYNKFHELGYSKRKSYYRSYDWHFSLSFSLMIVATFGYNIIFGDLDAFHM